MAFDHVGFTIRWEGEGVEEVGILNGIDQKKFEAATQQSVNQSNLPQLNSTLVRVDPRYFRPTEVELLIGDPTKSKTKLGWEPEYDLPALVKDMMQADIKLFLKEKELQENGHRILKQAE